jgi:hypothetical protein
MNLVPSALGQKACMVNSQQHKMAPKTHTQVYLFGKQEDNVYESMASLGFGACSGTGHP